ncbi:hypothetical protein HORIV_35270 [Vreelandella olivaria]|uniref:Uncharacterized protein n=1 Tax=Vreelandella olivaria TaxID=390919 RepID=A0ABM7GKK1_9GAMM|nr:hypothetical protein HORIV_35270 [Halomonas olivaria]
MAITDNPKLEYESGQSFNDWEHLSDMGDATIFEATFAPGAAALALKRRFAPGAGDRWADPRRYWQ